MKGKIDFIVCEGSGAWYLESLQVPEEIATQPNAALVEYAKAEKFNNEPDILFVGVYWRDSVADELGLTTEAAVSVAYNKHYKKVESAAN